MLFAKIETEAQISDVVARVDAAGGGGLAIWIMIETPVGVRNVELLARSSGRVSVLVMGTSDLVQALPGRHSEDRRGVSYALARCVLAARAAGKDILDGVHLDFRNAESFRAVCEQGRDMGFDGKTLIHPTQVQVANEIFGPTLDDVDFARRVLAAWRTALEAGRGVAEVDGQLIENLHVTEAQRAIAFAEAIAARE